jgi:hypothetical protein
VLFRAERFDRADAWYALIDPAGIHGPVAAFERAWTRLHVHDPNRVLGLLLTLKAPTFAEQELVVEAGYLRALAFFTLCEHDAAEVELEGLEAGLDVLEASIAAVDPDGALAWQDWLGAPAMPPSVQHRLLADRRVAATADHLDQVNEELARIGGMRASFRAKLGGMLTRLLERDAERSRRFGGSVVRSILDDIQGEAEATRQQAAVLRLEITTAELSDLEQRMVQPYTLDAAARTVDYAVRTDLVYWPFNGEFWRDELGEYRYTEPGGCRR